MKKRELLHLGIPRGAPLDAALRACAAAKLKHAELRTALVAVVDHPDAYADDPLYGELAAALNTPRTVEQQPLREDLDYASWGEDIEPAAREQMHNACRLPVSVAAALMPDAHLGYGLPIGGVLATDNAVIPYAVGVDIACRVRMTVFDLPPTELERDEQRFARVLERETLFGVGKSWHAGSRPDHAVMDEDWGATEATRTLKDLAWKQLGTSGSGNHFVEFGEIEFGQNEQGVAPGKYVAVVSHSGSRGAGSKVANRYCKIARNAHPELPKQLTHLAWLSLDDAGAEYWAAMELMGKYAHANHAVIHEKITRALGAPVLFNIENHHNFAWKETHGGREVIVHRKGATPAGEGVLGYIPGSMTAPGYLVVGKGNPASLDSASHGAGRRMSRRQAKETTRWSHLRSYLRERGVTLLSAGLDESPHAYKDIEEVMTAQRDLVTRVARFSPKLVKMAPDDDRPED